MMHRKRAKGKSIDKMPGPEKPDVQLGSTEDLEHADQSLFAADMSLIEAS